MLLTEVVSDVVHITCSPQSPELGIELLGRFNEVTGHIHFVCAFDLICYDSFVKTPSFPSPSPKHPSHATQKQSNSTTLPSPNTHLPYLILSSFPFSYHFHLILSSLSEHRKTNSIGKTRNLSKKKMDPDNAHHQSMAEAYIPEPDQYERAARSPSPPSKPYHP